MSIQLSRRTIITMLGGAVAGHTSAWGHDLRPGDPGYRFQDYEAIVNRIARVNRCMSGQTLRMQYFLQTFGMA